MTKRQFLTLSVFMLLFVVSATSKSITNPYTTRLVNAINHCAPGSTALYKELLNIHRDARNNGATLVYPDYDVNNSGKTIRLTISSAISDEQGKIPSIPLCFQTDFNGWRFEVSSDDTAPDQMYLFRFSEGSTRSLSTTINKQHIDSGNFEDISELNVGTKLLIIQDQTPWTYRNEMPDTYFPNGKPGTPWQNWNHNTPMFRSDILLLEDGMARNRVICPYNTTASRHGLKYVIVNSQPKSIKNITLHRTSDNVGIINLMHISNTNNITLSDINILTDPSPIITEAKPMRKHDAAISIVNVTNLTINNYSIQHTYSTAKEYGYGLDMNNIWNSHISNMNATNPAWGVFGNNNLNSVILDHCSLNRFDLHMYGRDITCTNCIFRNDNYLSEVMSPDNLNNISFQEENPNFYNRYVSLYDTLTYENCLFDGFIPFRTDYGYNIYTSCDVKFRNCAINIYQKKYAYLFLIGYWGAPDNERPELAKRSWPNVWIDHLDIRLQTGIKDVYLFYLLDRETQRIPINTRLIYGTSFLEVNDLRITDLNNHPISDARLSECNLSHLINYALPVNRTINHRVFENPNQKLVIGNNDDEEYTH